MSHSRNIQVNFYSFTVHLDNVNSLYQQMQSLLNIKMLKFLKLKYHIFAPTCFGPPGPSSGSLY